MQKIITILIIFLLSGCGYSSVYKNNDTKDLKITIESMEGNREINNLIKNQLKIYSSKNSTNEFNISVKTNFQKNIISKNSSGKISKYQLYIKAEFKINNNQKIYKEYFEEKFNIKNISDPFEQDNYERIITNNLISSIREKLILRLSNIR